MREKKEAKHYERARKKHGISRFTDKLPQKKKTGRAEEKLNGQKFQKRSQPGKRKKRNIRKNDLKKPLCQQHGSQISKQKKRMRGKRGWIKRHLGLFANPAKKAVGTSKVGRRR